MQIEAEPSAQVASSDACAYALRLRYLVSILIAKIRYRERKDIQNSRSILALLNIKRALERTDDLRSANRHSRLAGSYLGIGRK